MKEPDKEETSEDLLQEEELNFSDIKSPFNPKFFSSYWEMGDCYSCGCYFHVIYPNF